MKLREAKKRTARILLMFFMVWPLVQFGLTRATDLNPWKLMGMGMYTIPEYRLRGRFLGIRQGELESLPVADRPELGAELNRWVRRRWALGGLTRPDALADRLLTEFPGLDGVQISLERNQINLRTGIVEREIRTFVYDR